MKFIANKERLCKCGCGKPVKLIYSGNRFKGYGKYSDDCDHKNGKGVSCPSRGKLGELNTKSMPIGSTRLHQSSDKLIYEVIKIAHSGRWVYRHRYIMEQFIGRKLNSKEHVHHIDGNTLNNDLTNLKILTIKEHSSLHNTTQSWSKLFEFCICCGSKKHKHLAKGLCSSCYQKLDRINNPNKFKKYDSKK